MNLPQPGDYIDIHTHGGKAGSGVFFIENMMAHEERTPKDFPEQACTFGIHPWFLNKNNYDQLLNNVKAVTGFSNLVAIGESGFDKLRGPATELQRRSFEEQIAISEAIKKPIIIHASNRNRQLPALKSTQGLPKAEVMGQRLKDINPDIKKTAASLGDQRWFYCCLFS